MFERFTSDARRVLVLASEEARKLGHDYLGSEHLLLALLHDDQSAAVRLLSALGIPPAAVRRGLEQSVPAGAGESPAQLPFKPEAKRALELAMLEAVRLDSPHIGTGHLLLGLIRDDQGLAAQVLAGLGADLDQARHEVSAQRPSVSERAERLGREGG